MQWNSCKVLSSVEFEEGNDVNGNESMILLCYDLLSALALLVGHVSRLGVFRCA